MMELTLNLVWVIIAGANYAFLLRRLAARKAEIVRGPNRSQCMIALTCVLAILFPVISLTDDLHEMQATLEEATPSGLVMKKCASRHSSTIERTLHQVIFTSALFAASARWAIVGGVAARHIGRPSPGLHFSALGRAPPSFGVSQLS